MNLSRFLALALATLCVAGTASAQNVVFDSITGQLTPSLPTATRTYMGQGFTPALGGNFITGGSVNLASAATVNYTNLTLRIQFWGTFDSTGGGSATGLVFSNPIGAPILFNAGAFAATANTFNTFTFTLGTPVALVGTGPFGITFSFQGDTGTGLASTDNLTTLVRTGALAAGTNNTGTAPNFGYFRNASGRTDFNFQSNDFRQIGANSALSFTLTAVPEPGTVATFAVGGMALLGVAIRRRRA